MGAGSPDVIVIGAGIGGLACAAYLGLQAQDVLVIERRTVAGGCCSRFKNHGFTFDAAVHHVSGGGPHSLIRRALSQVGARVDFIRLDPMDTLVWPDLRFQVPGRWEALLAALISAFPSEATGLERAFLELLRLYRAVLGSPGGAAVYERWAERTFLEFLTNFVDDERLVRVLSGQWGYLGAPPQRLSAPGMCQMLVNYWRDGAHYPRGGTQVIPNALVAAIERAGGSVQLCRGVRRIVVDGQRAVGVELEGGTCVRARWIISNVDVPQVVGRLLEGSLPLQYRKHVSRLELSAPFFLLYLGIGGGFQISRLPRGFYHLDSRLGGPWLYVSSASEVDGSLTQPGKHAVTVVVSLAESEAAISSWKTSKKAKTQETLSLLDGFAPGLARHIEVVQAAHPPTRTRRCSNLCGAPYGWAVIPGQAGLQRLPSETPLANVYLTGQWTRPGPGVCAVLASGWRTANQVLRAAARQSSAQPS